MTNSWDHLKSRREKLAGFKKILKDMDPASGVSFSVRRGVIWDNDAIEDDCIRRPWITVESSDLQSAKTIIELIIQDTEKQIKFWENNVKRDIEIAQKILLEK